MQALDPVEAALARLMPPALSDSGQLAIETMLDELAGPAARPAPARVHRVSWWLGSGIAAAIAVVCAIDPISKTIPNRPLTVDLPAPVKAGLVLISESSRVESMTDEGWQEDADGAAMQAVRLNVVDENNLRDQETGMIVRISEPREEILLTPVSAF